MATIKNAPLKDLAYYRTGGTCDVLYAPESLAELEQQLKDMSAQHLPFFVLGGGTNSLVMDDSWPGAVISFHLLNRIEVRGNSIYAEAGADNTQVVKTALQAGLSDITWMNRLPGQIGGTVRMNARCYGGEISQVVDKVWAFTPQGEAKVYTDKGMFKGYKDTIFMQNKEIIAAANIALVPMTDREAAIKHMTHCETDRTNKGQFEYPTCGCVFKNDYSVGVPSGMLIDQSGGKSLTHGHASINPHHANFVYNKGASSNDILELTLQMREVVYKKYGVWMEYEMEILGHVPEDLWQRVQEKRPAQFNDIALADLRKKFHKK